MRLVVEALVIRKSDEEPVVVKKVEVVAFWNTASLAVNFVTDVVARVEVPNTVSLPDVVALP